MINSDTLYFFRDVLNPNKIIIKANEDINIDQVEVFWESAAYESKKVFSKGKELKVKYKEYGDNNFYVLHKGDTIVKFYYFKTNNWHGHKHFISLNKDSVVVKITGPDDKILIINKF